MWVLTEGHRSILVELTCTRELTNHEDGFLKDKKCVIKDCDTTFRQSFRTCLRREVVKRVGLRPRSPNLNARLERFFGSLKSGCLRKLILSGGNATCKTVRAFPHIITLKAVTRVWQRTDRADESSAGHECRDRNDEAFWWFASIVSTRGLACPMGTRSAPLRSQ